MGAPLKSKTTPEVIHSAVREAEIAAQRQRFAGLELLRVDERKATPEELSIYGKIKGCTDAAHLDQYLSKKRVVDLFFRGVLFFSSETL